MRRITQFVIAGATLAFVARYSRERLKNDGSSHAEQSMQLPGDGIIGSAAVGGTMGCDFDAPPEELWPWLIQMGADRAGFYSWDFLDNGRRPSARTIHPEWQDLNEGDRVASTPDGSLWFDVAMLVPERVLVLRAPIQLPAAKMFDPSGSQPKYFNDSTWAFHLLPSAGGGTRLLVRGAAVGRPHSLLAAANLLFWDPAHWVMQRKQFTELKDRVDTATAL